VLWWSPDPRMVMYVDEFHLSHTLRKTVRKFARTQGREVRFDSDFRAVITAWPTRRARARPVRGSCPR